MKKLLAALAVLVALVLPAPADAAYIQNTGWPCSPAGATIPVAWATIYSCYGTPLTWHLVYYGP